MERRRRGKNGGERGKVGPHAASNSLAPNQFRPSSNTNSTHQLLPPNWLAFPARTTGCNSRECGSSNCCKMAPRAPPLEGANKWPNGWPASRLDGLLWADACRQRRLDGVGEQLAGGAYKRRRGANGSLATTAPHGSNNRRRRRHQLTRSSRRRLLQTRVK